jgi:cell division protein ZapA (FtsZ GTPase activity inhibitor)
MTPTPPKKSEHIQVKVINSLLDVRGQFERERMEKAARILDTELRRRLDRQSGDLPEHGFLSIVLLTAIEKIYEIDRLREHNRVVSQEIEAWRRWAQVKVDQGGLSRETGKE